ncbi:MAG: phosphoadenylyl-sulfate reductase [Zetaproteobacteria bacterium CG06_land_8_20_14_3_00_59_53]|nr:MAG: phosphoadenylyl-sulfate reductase [Zetaproteobacteria bacterium CG23_combo_of_CG06-09_8_20_14_all_59_86]PIQ64066.1 MAG: phosphoadenylyl-sulfate reductase [Zetaproteobacteria bacterium CG11_big_fil_rev_8_21_14_0_20_59_439]PIU69628.1 MAG: phosphoadenylyl-sulfate reductase [Zetaproteobacteria bacterium CG06_land_8_20_14_3_00_59_53]PIU96260.1 MAG: phosphoadenylyl-sulfate reductase [Zetaproteobacteria bacterium CG03_land_8_20_14_0_80_59_51]PIY44856.1 MAG: phosphoadenylyl-sulfate reductase [Z
MSGNKIEAALALLNGAIATHGSSLIYPSSFAAEASVLIDMIGRNNLPIPVLTLDTGRLPQSTYDVISEVEQRYDMKVQIVFPDCREVEQMVRDHGVNLFRHSIEERKLCCQVRKVNPLNRVLHGKTAWITGRRREQSEGRGDLQSVERDPVYGLTKYNPLLDWSWEEIWDYIRANDVPYNKLHDHFYHSIGCECCTRAISVGEDARAGRWWWENDESVAECGLHVISPILEKPAGEEGEGI